MQTPNPLASRQLQILFVHNAFEGILDPEVSSFFLLQPPTSTPTSILHKNCPQSCTYIQDPPIFVVPLPDHITSRDDVQRPLECSARSSKFQPANRLTSQWFGFIEVTASLPLLSYHGLKAKSDMQQMFLLSRLRSSHVDAVLSKRSVLPKPVIKLLRVQVLLSSKAQVLLKQTAKLLQLPSKVKPNLSHLLQQRLPQSQLLSQALLESSHILLKLPQSHLTLSHSRLVLTKPNRSKRLWRSSWMRRTEP
jgi:hypothetical protein